LVSTDSANDNVGCVALMNQELIEAKSLLLTASEIKQLLCLAAAQRCYIAGVDPSQLDEREALTGHGHCAQHPCLTLRHGESRLQNWLRELAR
jgi:hypothetical protein